MVLTVIILIAVQQSLHYYIMITKALTLLDIITYFCVFHHVKYWKMQSKLIWNISWNKSLVHAP